MFNQDKYNKYLLDRKRHEIFWNSYKLQFKNKYLVSPDKEEFEIIGINNLRDFCRKHGNLSSTVMLQLVKGKISKYWRWTVKSLEV